MEDKAKKVCLDWDKPHVGVAIDADGGKMAYGPFPSHAEAEEWAAAGSQRLPTIAFTFLTLRPADAIDGDVSVHVRTILKKVDPQQDREN